MGMVDQPSDASGAPDDGRAAPRPATARRAVLLCANPELGHVVLRSLRANGFRVLLVLDRRAAVLRLSRLAEDVLLAGADLVAEDPLRIARLVNDAHAARPVDLVLSADVEGQLLLAAVRDHLQPPCFPMPTLAALRRLDEKGAFYEDCTAWGIRCPRSLTVAGRHAIDPDAVAAAIGFPCIVKPVSSFGGTGFVRLDGPAALARDVIGNPNYVFAPLILQEYVPGIDVGLGLFARDGQVEYAAAFECGDNLATRFVDLPDLVEMGRRVVAETAYSGVCNFDARLDPATGRVTMIECNPRFFMRLSTSRLCGLDLLAAGLAPVPSARRPGAVVHAGFYAARELLSVRGARRLAAAGWPLRPTFAGLRETALDPLPVIVRRLHLGRVAGVE